jgi:hypothetical protein
MSLVTRSAARGTRESTSDYSAALAHNVAFASMLTPVDDDLRREARRYRLVFGCESCAHFDAPGQRCANGYPIDSHFGVDLDLASELAFCKEFELG